MGFNLAPLDDPGASFGIIGATMGHLTAALVGPQSIIEKQVYSMLAFLELLGGAPKGSSASLGGACEGT